MNNKCKVTESVFNAIKFMLNGGATNIECAKYMEISDSTVSIIRRSENYEEYKHNCYITSSSYRNRVAAIKRKEEEKKAKVKEVAENVGAVPASEIDSKKAEEVIKEIRQTVTIQATHYMEQEMRKTNELLTIINNKLGAIIDDLYGVKKNDS